MYLGTISNPSHAIALHPALQQFFDFISAHDLNSLPIGRTDIDGDRIYLMHQDVEQPNSHSQPLEAHCRYLDVQILLEGEEEIGWKPTQRIESISTPYNSESDILFSNEVPDFFVKLQPGDFCIFFPEDAHAPCISTNPLRKVVGKILLEG